MINYSIAPGACSVNYAPLPSSVAQGSLQQLAKITDAGTPVKPSANA